MGFNISLFLVASSESQATGVFMHFISASAVAIFVFEFEQRWKSIAFISLSVSLFIIANLVPMDFIPYRTYSPENERIFFILHTVGTALISCFSLFSLLGEHHTLQKGLRKHQKTIESQNRDLRKANEELDRFVYSASHDLRAPLASIRGLITLMGMENPSINSDYTTKIQSRISVMDAFINDIVNYSRNSRTEIVQEQVELQKLIEDIESSLSHFDNAESVEIINDIPPEVSIPTDHYRLRVILTNLISNSIKYADLRKEYPFVKINYCDAQDFRSIIVEDNGIGIDEEHLPKVFNMFYRASQLSKGSGLGLYIAMESIEKLNYKIEIDSTIKIGTSFKILIPKT